MPGSLSVFILATISFTYLVISWGDQGILPSVNPGKFIFLRAWNTLTKRVGKHAACGIAGPFLGLQNLGFIFLHFKVIR